MIELGRLLYGIVSIYALPTLVAVTLIMIAVLRFLPLSGLRNRLASPGMSRAVAVVGIGAVGAAYLGLQGLKSLTPPLGAQFQAQIAAVGTYWAMGGNIYGSPADGTYYSSGYGPLPYMVFGPIIAATGSFLAAKVVSSLILFAGACAWLAAFRLRLSTAQAGVMVAAVYLGMLTFDVIDGPRADLFLLPVLGVACWAILREKSPLPDGLAAGAVTALLPAMKLNYALYAVPLLVILLMDRRHRTLQAMLAGGFAVSAAIWLAPGVSLLGYVTSLMSMAKHGLSTEIFIDNIQTTILLSIPALFAWGLAGPVGRRERLALITVAVCALVTSIPASKPGSGANHLHGFIPMFMLFALGRAQPVTGVTCWNWNRLRIAGVMAWIGVTAFLGLAKQTSEILFYWPRRNETVITDIATALAKYQPRNPHMGAGSGAPFGVGGPAKGWATTWYRALVVRSAGDYIFDPSAWIDYANSGERPSAHLIEKIRSCEIDLWLIPVGEKPFTLTFRDRDLFDDDFRAEFSRSYTLVETKQYFDLWRCGNSNGPMN